MFLFCFVVLYCLWGAIHMHVPWIGTNTYAFFNMQVCVLILSWPSLLWLFYFIGLLLLSYYIGV